MHYVINFCRLACSESVQYFQFDSTGNMYVYPAGSGWSGTPRLVKPGEDLNNLPECTESCEKFDDTSACKIFDVGECSSSISSDGCVSMSRPFNEP